MTAPLHQPRFEPDPQTGGTPARPAVTAAALAATLGVAAVCWAVALAAGGYEFTPLKRHCRRRCRGSVGSGFEFGLDCVGSSIGRLLLVVALGVMSVTWMSVIAVLVLAQKLLPANAAIDVPLALGIVGLGILIVIAPWAVPGLAPPM